jgi:hypothetical protein
LKTVRTGATAELQPNEFHVAWPATTYVSGSDFEVLVSTTGKVRFCLVDEGRLERVARISYWTIRETPAAMQAILEDNPDVVLLDVVVDGEWCGFFSLEENVNVTALIFNLSQDAVKVRVTLVRVEPMPWKKPLTILAATLTVSGLTATLLARKLAARASVH